MSVIKEMLKKVPGLRAAVIRARTMRDRTLWRVQDICNQLRLRQLRNIHRGRRAWVMGNGPSLTRLDLSELKDEITFGVNGIWLLFDQLGWMPTYYVVEDSCVAEDDAETINAIHGPIKIFPRDLKRVLKPDGKTLYVQFRRGRYRSFPRFSDDISRIVYWGGTVTYMNLQLAHYMGCNPIYLIGCDMTYKVPDHVDGTVITSREDDVNHFDPRYFGPGKRWHHPRVDRMILCLEHAAQHLAAQGVRVYNATLGGKLEVFPRVAYEHIFQSVAVVRR